MRDATISAASKSWGDTTIRPQEAAHFGALARDWWDPKGPMASLHRLNPLRMSFVRAAIDSHWESEGAAPLTGKRALDVGCGAGLLCEPLARLGAKVTGVDAAPANIAAATDHAARAGLEIEYLAGELTNLGIGRFDLVTCLEVIEHVADKRAFIASLASALAPGGLMVLSTPNRTMASRLLLVEGAERLGMVPRGTHSWDDFVTPEELGALLAEAGLVMGEAQGIGWSVGKGLHLSRDLSLNYLVTVLPACPGLPARVHR